jgi:hypothetical protein
MALPLLTRFHPDAVGQYPQQPMMKAGPVGGPRPAVTVTGCGTTSGTVMNLEPAAGAVTQKEVSVDFLLNELGSGNDLVVEHGTDYRGQLGTFDSLTALYVHRDATVPCYGGMDFEMPNPPIPDPFNQGSTVSGTGTARLLADPNPAHKQFIFADLRFNGTTSGIGMRRIPASNFESTSTCPAGTLTGTQEDTCAGTTAIVADASLDDFADSPSIAQDPRTSGTGAGDIYIVNTSFRYLRSVIVLTACKATFATSADCSAPLVISGNGETATQFPSVAVVAGGGNAGYIVITYVDGSNIEYLYCTPGGAPNPPTCTNPDSPITISNPYISLTDNPAMLVNTWPVIAARTDAGGGKTIFVVWSECKPYSFPLTACPDADVKMAYRQALASGSWTVTPVTTVAGHQFMPSIAYDTGQNVITIAYYGTNSDVYKNRVVMLMKQIASGTVGLGNTFTVTTSYDSIAGDGTSPDFSSPLGDYMGLAAHGGTGMGSSRVYLGFTNNARQGTYNGISNTQADNNVSQVTY